jgi:hypothetical protein
MLKFRDFLNHENCDLISARDYGARLPTVQLNFTLRSLQFAPAKKSDALGK